MKIDGIFKHLISKYSGLVINKNWGERGLFYNPGGKLKLGAYMLTFKEKDGKNDSSSNISGRTDVFRLNMKISKSTFTKLFISVPERPVAGGIVATGHDFTQLDTIMPHPVYGWMTWICVHNPSQKTINHMESTGLFDEAYNAATETFNKKTGVKKEKSKESFFNKEVSDNDKKRKLETVLSKNDLADELLCGRLLVQKNNVVID
jgi:hypothetical protein